MESTIIIIDSDDEDNQKQMNEIKSSNKVEALKRPIETVNGNGNSDNISPPNKIRRIQPQKIGTVNKEAWKTSSGEESSPTITPSTSSESNAVQSITEIKDENDDVASSLTNIKEKHENEVTKELKAFIKACRMAESNDDMKKIIKSKLIKYYNLVSPQYVLSNYFRKNLEVTALAILKDPRSVYSKLQDIINELKSRKNSLKTVVINVPEKTEETSAETEKTEDEEKNAEAEKSGDEETSVKIEKTLDDKKDNKLRKLNRGLAKLKKEIEKLDVEEVDWDDDDNVHMKKVRYEKRAVEIYNKICSITGEDSHAYRIIKKPVKFDKTRFTQFNKRLTKKINKENGFPSYYDVCRLLDFCNKEYKYELQTKEMDRIAQDAFQAVGQLLKKRRQTDLYESATILSGKSTDPAKEDPDLRSKLEKNKEFYRKRTDEIIELFVNKQLNGESPTSDNNAQEPCTSQNETEKSPPPPREDKDEDIPQFLPAENLMSIIDVKAEKISEDCDKLNGEKNDPNIDITLSF